MLLQYVAEHKAFVLRCRFDERFIAKDAGLIWNSIVPKHWATLDVGVAVLLKQYASPQTLDVIERILAKRKERMIESAAVDVDVDLPKPEGLEYLGYQKVGIVFALKRPASLIADAMGLGKTIETIGVINADPSVQSVLVITKASLKVNWYRELKKWLVRPLTVEIVKNKFPIADVVIINYDVLHKWIREIHAREWHVIAIDEAHNLKNLKARRSRMVFGYKSLPPMWAKRRLLLTGTPIVNNPPELWGLLHYIAPKMWPNYWTFVRQYAVMEHNGFGWKARKYDPSNEAERLEFETKMDALQKELRGTVMLRRLKEDVLKDLPPITYQVLEIPRPAGVDKLLEKEVALAGQSFRLGDAIKKAGLVDNQRALEEKIQQLKNTKAAKFQELAALRKKLSVFKTPLVIEHLEALLEETQKLIVFGHHREMLEALVQHFAKDGAVLVYGGMQGNTRQIAIDRFQNDDSCRVFVGSLRAAGEGLNLTAASTVVLAEQDWTPGVVSQAISRSHRYGQNDRVLAQILVLEGSLDAKVAKTFVSKQHVIDLALDKRSDNANIAGQSGGVSVANL